jgi:hypothetical protein
MVVTAMNKTTRHPPPAIDGTRVEMGIYETIMAAYQCTQARGGDHVTTGSRIVAVLARMMKEGGNGCAGTTRNGLLLLLALFFPRGEQAGLPGDDVTTLTVTDREVLLADLVGALPGD